MQTLARDTSHGMTKAPQEKSTEIANGAVRDKRLIHYVLGTFTVLTLCFSIYTGYKIIHIFRQSIAVDLEWSSRTSHYADLRQLAVQVSAPGDDVFESRDVRRESARLRRAVHAFNASMVEARQDLATIDESDASLLASGLDEIESKMDRVVSEANQVMIYFEKNMIELSTRRMAAMDRRHAEVNASITNLQAAVRAMQRQNLDRQLASARNFQRAEYFLGGLILILIFSIVLYGCWIATRAKEELCETEERLKAITFAEQRYGAVIESMMDAQILADQHGVIQSVNTAGREMFGYTLDEMLGMNLSMLMPEPHRSAHDGYLEHYMDMRMPIVLGKRRQEGLFACRKDGSEFSISLNTHEIRLGGEVFFSGLIRDTSMEQVNKENLQLLKAALEHTDEAIAITDTEGRFKYVNPAFQAITGYSREETIGQKSNTLLRSGEQSDEFYADLWTTITSGRVWEGKLRNRKKDGTIYDERQTISPILDRKSREITGYVAVKRDITEQLQMGQRLNQAQKLESIGQLAAGIAHEINTPTQYVGDNTRFVKDAFDDVGALLDKLIEMQASANGAVSAQALGEALEQADVEYLKDEIPRALTQSLEGVERVAKIVRAMKEFSHPAQEKTFVDLNSAIQSTLTVACNEWKYVAEIQTDFDPELPQVNCLPGEFNQVILNIVVNAAHAIADKLGESPSTKGVISVATQQVDDYVEISITDTGCGMPENIKRRIFDPFFTTKEVGKGTGQGLNIAHDVVVNKHDGEIKVDSEPGKGTCFIIRLPLESRASPDAVVTV